MYIGQDLQVAFSSYLNIDDISGSFNSVTTSFALTVNGSTPVPLPINSQQCLISVGGIIQRPDDTGTEGFRLSGSNIVFSSAPNTGEDFFGTILAGADYINAGVNFPDGQSSAPSITFDQDLDTGFFRSSSGAVSFSSNGVNTATLGSNSFTAPSFIPTSSSVPSNGVFLPAANSVAIATNGTQQATVDSSGRLLVGTSSTSATSSVIIQNNSANSGPGILRLATNLATPADGNSLGLLTFGASNHSTAASINSSRDGGTWTAGTSQPSRLAFSTTADGASSPTERMRIRQNGKVWIGTTSAIRAIDRESLCVKGNSGEAILVQTNGITYAGYVFKDADGGGGTHYIGYWENSAGTNVGAITHNNTTTAYVTSSDYRLKENVVDIDGAIDRLKQLPVHRFNFIADPDHTVDGFIAHEAQAVVPECVIGEKDEVEVWKEGEELPDGVSVGDNKLNEDGNTIPVYQGIDQSKLVPLLTAALQEAVAKIESLEARLTAAGI